ncbi:MAG: class I SAM-dependent methyltransferase [Bacteroidota bacterium]
MEQIETCEICGKNSFSKYLDSQDYFLTQEKFTIVKCNNCQFLFVNPRPTETEIRKYYQSKEYISHSNSKKGLINQIYQFVRKRNNIKKFNLIQKYKQFGTILDIGCATGEFLNYFKKNGWKVVGLEPNEHARNFAKTKYGLNIFPERFLYEKHKEKFDVITMWHVLEHIHFLSQRIEQVKNNLRQGGVLIIAVPNVESKDSKIYGKFWAGYDLPRHIYHFTQSSIKELFKKFGFDIIETVPMKSDSYYISMLSEYYIRGKRSFIRTLLNGFLSNQWAKRNNNNFSSLIFVLKKH